jgi:serine/threonine protein kinase
MAIAEEDDSKPERELPHLPDLPGMEGPASRESPTSATGANLTPEFQNHGDERDPSGRVDLPEVKLATADEIPLVVPGKDPYLGKQFGGYELVQKVGQGGMGLVYKGRQVSLDRVVAVKILNKALCDNEEFIKRFEREAKSIARINHPNIMAVYDFGQTDGIWYMVIEYIEGSSLSKQIADRLMMPIQDLAPLLVQCLAGLAHVGQQGIVHRDIKPDNILITKDGIAKIADFGLAKDVSRNDTTDLTTVGMAMGTPAYMSPEQCMGRKLDGRSDIYSLGVAVYLALTGEKPFTGQSSFEIMTKQREFTPPSPAKLNPNVPREVSELVMQMLAKSPNDRFRDAEQCRQAWLELGGRLGFLNGGGHANDPHSLGLELAKSVRKSSASVPALPLAMTASAIAAGAALAPAPMPLPPPRTAESARTPATDGPAKPKSRTTGEFPVPADGDSSSKLPSDRQQRPTTERRTASRGSATDAVTCTRCGLLNRRDAGACSRCGHELRETSRDPVSTKDQETEAQRLFAVASYREAADIYARLADKESDRRARAILRSKEREARTLEQQGHVVELQNRSQGMIERGDIKAGINLLERGLRDVRDAGASSTGAETKLLEQINDLRARLRRRKRMRLMLVLILVVVLVAAAVLARMYGSGALPIKAAGLGGLTTSTREC